jgi:hypothetical protein
MILLLFLLVIAFVSLGFAVEYSNATMDPMMYLLFICLGIVAQVISMLSIETGIVLYPQHVTNCSRVISFLNCLFSAGSKVYQ